MRRLRYLGRGSSPQVRGPPGNPKERIRRCGLIPAGAGTTQVSQSAGLSTRTHPRRCGDHSAAAIARTVPSGSSPQVRGPHWRGIFHRSPRGLIPAGAGTTQFHKLRVFGFRAHPRRCGDHGPLRYRNRAVPGSSPQVRGPRCPAYPQYGLDGLIPAGAGTTESVGCLMGCRGAHPRRCGDHPTQQAFPQDAPGSSPQVRGPRADSPLRGRRTGLIPAGAGTTSPPGLRTHPAWAHPRRCGDHTVAPAQLVFGAGSSPQVRGPRNSKGIFLPPFGLIPAGAGTTNPANPASHSPRAHPRRCGDHCFTSTW